MLDVGCGPGRHSHALARRGVYSLGVDLSPVAVALAVGRGAHAIVGDVFAELPGTGQWQTVLLLDGNIGIGGAPERLLRRLAAVLAPAGTVLVELEAPGTRSGAFRARLEQGEQISDWFGWARLAVDAIAGPASGSRSHRGAPLGHRRPLVRMPARDRRGRRAAVATFPRVTVLAARAVTKDVGSGRGRRRVLDGVSLDGGARGGGRRARAFGHRQVDPAAPARWP